MLEFLKYLEKSSDPIPLKILDLIFLDSATSAPYKWVYTDSQSHLKFRKLKDMSFAKISQCFLENLSSTNSTTETSQNIFLQNQVACIGTDLAKRRFISRAELHEFKEAGRTKFSSMQLFQNPIKAFDPYIYGVSYNFCISSSCVSKENENIWRYWKFKAQKNSELLDQDSGLPLGTFEDFYKFKIAESMRIIINIIEKTSQRKLRSLKAYFAMYNPGNPSEIEAWLVGCENIVLDYLNASRVKIESKPIKTKINAMEQNQIQNIEKTEEMPKKTAIEKLCIISNIPDIKKRPKSTFHENPNKTLKIAKPKIMTINIFPNKQNNSINNSIIVKEAEISKKNFNNARLSIETKRSKSTRGTKHERRRTQNFTARTIKNLEYHNASIMNIIGYPNTDRQNVSIEKMPKIPNNRSRNNISNANTTGFKTYTTFSGDIHSNNFKSSYVSQDPKNNSNYFYNVSDRKFQAHIRSKKKFSKSQNQVPNTHIVCQGTTIINNNYINVSQSFYDNSPEPYIKSHQIHMSKNRRFHRSAISENYGNPSEKYIGRSRKSHLMRDSNNHEAIEKTRRMSINEESDERLVKPIFNVLIKKVDKDRPTSTERPTVGKIKEFSYGITSFNPL